jgi:aryl-alcohol dehydrogenase-like predicted oxidoreductase
MQTRLFGRSGHQSTVAIFGAAAFWEISQADADQVVEQVLAAGVNHFDVAPSYGQAEARLGPWMPRIRKDIFLGCKTTERTKIGVWNELRASLKRLQTETFDLYQFHAVTSMEELEAIFAQGGALEAVLEARQQGLFKYIGITGHGVDAPRIYLEALRRFDFDSILFPLNFVQMANPEYRKYTEDLIRTCRERNVGTMAIKTITKGPWGARAHTSNTWYEPFTQMEIIQRAVNFALSYAVTGLCTAGDTRILPLVLKACENFLPMSEPEREAFIVEGKQFEPLFV